MACLSIVIAGALPVVCWFLLHHPGEGASSNAGHELLLAGWKERSLAQTAGVRCGLCAAAVGVHLCSYVSYIDRVVASLDQSILIL